ncbi:MAG: hypothetical protein ABL891_03610 [Burkholderiales bacterium]
MNKRGISILIAALLMSTSAFAQDKVKKGEKPHSTAEVQKDILDHRAMADAHLAAAKCLEGGKGEKDCHAQLTKDCKGLGIGKLCGMKHKH